MKLNEFREEIVSRMIFKSDDDRCRYLPAMDLCDGFCDVCKKDRPEDMEVNIDD